MTIAGAVASGAPRRDLIPRRWDAVLLVSYGGPEGPDDVLPFLENATRGRGVPRDRLLEVANHYHHFGGISPITAQNRALAAGLREELARRGAPLPVYLGNRNWHPFLADTIRQMRTDGIRRGLALVTSAFSCYSSCRQYREDILRACSTLGEGGPEFDRVRAFFNHPAFIAANAARLEDTLAALRDKDRAAAHLVFTAHSIPLAMARPSAYEAQLREASRLVAQVVGVARWSLAFQSRSGPPEVPWLGPDIGDHLDALAAAGVTDVVAQPIGFLSDHMEVRYDLDVEAAERARRLALRFHRVPTVGTHPGFISGLADLVAERLTGTPLRPTIGGMPAGHDICPVDCCPDGRPSEAAG